MKKLGFLFIIMAAYVHHLCLQDIHRRCVHTGWKAALAASTAICSWACSWGHTTVAMHADLQHRHH